VCSSQESEKTPPLKKEAMGLPEIRIDIAGEGANVAAVDADGWLKLTGVIWRVIDLGDGRNMNTQ
jgi:hypothetical protein